MIDTFDRVGDLQERRLPARTQRTIAIMTKQDAADFNWHVVVGDREMSGTARTAAERDVRQTGAKDLMVRDPQAGTAKSGA